MDGGGLQSADRLFSGLSSLEPAFLFFTILIEGSEFTHRQPVGA
jgi:hypothetical protein